MDSFKVFLGICGGILLAISLLLVYLAAQISQWSFPLILGIGIVLLTAIGILLVAGSILGWPTVLEANSSQKESDN